MIPPIVYIIHITKSKEYRRIFQDTPPTFDITKNPIFSQNFPFFWEISYFGGKFMQFLGKITHFSLTLRLSDGAPNYTYTIFNLFV